MKFTKLQFCFLFASWLSIAVRADLVAPSSYVKPIQGTVDSVPSGHVQAPSLRGRKSANGSDTGKAGATSSNFANKVQRFREKYPQIRERDAKALVLREMLLDDATTSDYDLEETLAHMGMSQQEMQSIFLETHHEGFPKEVKEAFQKRKTRPPVIPRFDEAMQSLDYLQDEEELAEARAWMLHDLIIQAAEANYTLEYALTVIGVDQDQMDHILEGYDDLANDIIEAFEDLDERQYELGQEIQRHLQDHLVRDEDGNLEYRKDGILDKVEEVKGHHRNLEASRRLRWDKYYSELDSFPNKLREHGRLLTNLVGVMCEESTDEAICFSYELEEYASQVEEMVVAMEDEVGPFIAIMKTLDETVGEVKKHVSTIGTMKSIFGMLKRMPGSFGKMFGLAHTFFLNIDSMANPVEESLDNFQDKVLTVWESTAGYALDRMFEFEEAFGSAVGVFSLSAHATEVPALPQIFKAMFKFDLQDYNDVVMVVRQHIITLVKSLQSLVTAFESEVFETFRNTADDFVDAIDEVGVIMKAFEKVETAIKYKITLPFGMPRGLKAGKLGKASCAPHQNKTWRTTSFPRYSGKKIFDLVGPFNVKCKERCPSGFKPLALGKSCKPECSSFGLAKHMVLGVQDGCAKKSVSKQKRSLGFGKSCRKKFGSGWYRSLPSDKCRKRCSSSYYGETYHTCTERCPSGLQDHWAYRNKACKIPSTAKFDRTNKPASCSQYVSSSRPKVYLKDVGGCFEDCDKSKEHSFRGLFFCVAKDKLQISIEDVINFVSNILSKIDNIPGVGDVMSIIDKALEEVMGFVEDLIPEVSVFPEFPVSIGADFLDFGGLSSAFDQIDFPDMPVIPNPVDGLLEKFQNDLSVSSTPAGEIASCGSDMACVGEKALNALDLDEAYDMATSFLDKADEVQARLSAAFDVAGDVELITCSEPTTKIIPCSQAFFFLDFDEDCNLELPWCDKFDMSGLQDTLGTVSDMFDGVFEDQRRNLGAWSKYADGAFYPISTFSVPFFEFDHYTYFPKQETGLHLKANLLHFDLNIGLYFKKNKRPKLGFSWGMTGLKYGTDILVTEEKLYKKIQKFIEIKDERLHKDGPVASFEDCFETGIKMGSRDRCQRAWDWFDKLNENPNCWDFELQDLHERGIKRDDREKQEYDECVEEWFGLMNQVGTLKAKAEAVKRTRNLAFDLKEGVYPDMKELTKFAGSELKSQLVKSFKDNLVIPLPSYKTYSPFGDDASEWAREKKANVGLELRFASAGKRSKIGTSMSWCPDCSNHNDSPYKVGFPPISMFDLGDLGSAAMSHFSGTVSSGPPPLEIASSEDATQPPPPQEIASSEDTTQTPPPQEIANPSESNRLKNFFTNLKGAFDPGFTLKVTALSGYTYYDRNRDCEGRGCKWVLAGSKEEEEVFSKPSEMPSNMPSNMPTNMPTDMPSNMPSNMPTNMPSTMPSTEPSLSKSMEPWD